MSIKEVLNNSLQTETSDIADGAGLYVGTNPPRELNIAMAISGGRTTNIAEALDIHYGNTEPSFTISKAIAAGAGTDDPTKSIEDVMSEVFEEGNYCTVTFDAGEFSGSDGHFELWPIEVPEEEMVEPLDTRKTITFKIAKNDSFPSEIDDGYEINGYPNLIVGDNKWVLYSPDSSLDFVGYSLDGDDDAISFPYPITDDTTFRARWYISK